MADMVTTILELTATLSDAEVQRVLVKVNSLYAKRLADARRKAWKGETTALKVGSVTIDTSRERS